jgi:hypothetical protein
MGILTARGFSTVLRLSKKQLNAYMKAEDVIVLINEHDGLILELHWEMTGRFLSRPLNMNFIGERLARVKLMDREVAHLSSEDLLVYLCIHGQRHLWERLEWICTVAKLVDEKMLQWNLVFEIARGLKCHRILLSGIYLAHDIFGVNLPETVLNKIKGDSALPKIVAAVKQRLFPLSSIIQAPKPGNRFQSVQFAARDSLGEGVKYGMRELVLPREIDWKWVPLPGWLSFMYIFLRPLRLAIKLYSHRSMPR